MNMFKLHHKKERILTSSVFALALIAILVLGFKLDVFSGYPAPEGRAFDQSMNAKSAFVPEEHGYITIKAYRVNISTSSTVPAQMNFYIKQPSGLEIGYDSKTGMGTIAPAQVTKSDGVLYVPVSINSSETEDNVTLKLSVKFVNAGIYDALSNYTNCESGKTQKLSEISRVEYIDGSSSSKVQTSSLGPLCIKVSKNSLKIVKTSYLDSAAGVDLKNLSAVLALEKAASFEAGNNVVVVLELDELDNTRSDFKVSDLLPSTVTGKIDYVYISNGVVQNSSLINQTAGSVVFYGTTPSPAKSPVIGSLNKGKNYIIYRYKI